jgi:hypothetical protein
MINLNLRGSTFFTFLSKRCDHAGMEMILAEFQDKKVSKKGSLLISNNPAE